MQQNFNTSELTAASVRLGAALEEFKKSAAALAAAHVRMEAALQELQTSEELAHVLLQRHAVRMDPPSSYN